MQQMLVTIMFLNLIINTYAIVCQKLNQKTKYQIGSAVFELQAFKILPILGGALQPPARFFFGNFQATKLVEVSNPTFLRVYNSKIAIVLVCIHCF